MNGRKRPAADFDSADAELLGVLAELEQAENYKSWLLELISGHIRGDVLEVGAGHGTYASELRALGTSLTSVEPSAHAAAMLRSRVASLPDTTVVEGTVEDVAGDRFDSAVMLNVLEHIADDVDALREIRSRLAPGGTLCVWVPAFPALYGNFDRRIGHYRRYRRRDLARRAEQAGFETVSCRYANLPGFFAWFLVVRLFGATPTAGGLARIYDRFVVPVTRAVERRIAPPFGQSLLLIARAS